MIGSLLSSSIVKIGRRKAILLSNFVAVVGGLMQFIFNFWVIFAGKVVYAACAAVMLTGCALYLSETLPEDKVGSHGFAVNLGVTLGMAVTLNLGIAVSKDNPDSKSWLLVAFVPIVFAVANIITWLFCFRNEPINFCIANSIKGEYKAEAYDGIKKLYKTDDNMDAVYQVYENRKDPDDIKRDPFMLDQNRESRVNPSDADEMLEDGDLILGVKAYEKDEPSPWQVLYDPRYRCATAIGVVMAIFNQISGLNAINFYSSVIFTDVFSSDNAVTIG